MDKAQLDALRARYADFRGPWMNTNPDDIRALLAEVDALRMVVRLTFQFERGDAGRIWYGQDLDRHVDPGDAEYADVLRVVEWMESERHE